MLKTLGGDRLGSGNKMKIAMHNYERSTFDLSRVWRSTMNVGTLIPFFTELGLNGDTFDIDLSAMMRTVPTQGPLFGSYKLQMDVFGTPIRLYNGLLHNNALNIGMNMAQIEMPTITLKQAFEVDSSKGGQSVEEWVPTKKWSDTCLSAFFNKRGIAKFIKYDYSDGTANTVMQEMGVNALPYLCYYDIYKNYYANKQEKYGKVLSGTISPENYLKTEQIEQFVYSYQTADNLRRDNWAITDASGRIPTDTVVKRVMFKTKRDENTSEKDWRELKTLSRQVGRQTLKQIGNAELNEDGSDLLTLKTYVASGDYVKIYEDIAGEQIGENELILIGEIDGTIVADGVYYIYKITSSYKKVVDLEVVDFELSNIDDMRSYILHNDTVAIDGSTDLPYCVNCQAEQKSGNDWASKNEAEFNGICLKTYQSDIFNNWLQQEWVDNIKTMTSVSTTTGSFSMESLNLAKKIYELMNRIAVSGGTYEDWQEAVWGEEAVRRAESPIYFGGASAEIVFEEVISNSASEDEPLGTIAGRGNLNDFKNGHIVIKCEEPMVIMGIVSITPRLDYDSNDNWWMNEVKTLNDLHKPALDGIGFQDLLASNATYTARIGNTISATGGQVFTPIPMAIGKQPAWLNYQTAVNEVHGEFCDKNKTGWMVLTRDYTTEVDSVADELVTDFTTYIDPKKYNYPFAYKELDAQNFWCQIGVSITARRKMSAKQMPNV